MTPVNGPAAKLITRPAGNLLFAPGLMLLSRAGRSARRDISRIVSDISGRVFYLLFDPVGFLTHRASFLRV